MNPHSSNRVVKCQLYIKGINSKNYVQKSLGEKMSPTVGKKQRPHHVLGKQSQDGCHLPQLTNTSGTNSRSYALASERFLAVLPTT